MLDLSFFPQWSDFASDLRAVILSIVAAIVVSLSALFYRKRLRRLCVQVLWGIELDIAGEWKTTFKEKEQSFNEQVKLKQRGRKVWGDLIVEKQGRKITYAFKGVFRNRILTATYETTDRRDYEQGAFSLRYTSLDGTKCLIGQYIGISMDSDDLFSSQYRWELVKH